MGEIPGDLSHRGHSSGCTRHGSLQQTTDDKVNDTNLPHSSLKKLFELANVVTRDKVKDIKIEFWKDDAEFYKQAAKTPRSNCVMDVSKLLSAGVKMRSVHEALEDSLKNWKAES